MVWKSKMVKKYQIVCVSNKNDRWWSWKCIRSFIEKWRRNGKNGYVYVDEIDDESDIDNEDWANYLINEKKSTLSKVKGLLGLKDEIDSKKNGSSFSYLDSKNGLIK